MKFSLKKLKNTFSKILFTFGAICKKHPWLIFILLLLAAFIGAFYIFYQKAYLATNISPDPQVKKIQIDQSSLLEAQKIIQQRQKNIDAIMQKDLHNPFE